VGDWRRSATTLGVAIGIVVLIVVTEHAIAEARVPIALIGGLIGGYLLGWTS